MYLGRRMIQCMFDKAERADSWMAVKGWVLGFSFCQKRHGFVEIMEEKSFVKKKSYVSCLAKKVFSWFF